MALCSFQEFSVNKLILKEVGKKIKLYLSSTYFLVLSTHLECGTVSVSKLTNLRT